MNDIEKNREIVSNRIMEQAWHKFIYSYNNDNRKSLIKYIIDRYPIQLNSDKPFAVNLSEMGLPARSIQSSKNLDHNKLSVISDEYLKLTIARDLLEQLSKTINLDDSRLKKELMLRFFDCTTQINIQSLNQLLQMLIESQKAYKKIYEDYLKSGICDNPFDIAPIPMVLIEQFIPEFKNMIGNKSYCELLINHQKGIDISSYEAINNLLGSRITRDITLNIFCETDEWKTFYDQSKQVVEETHDYTIIDYDGSFKRSVKNQKQKYEIEER